jgi:hypothetical protein
LQPAPGDLFVVTLLSGRIALVRPAQEYEQVLDLAQAFANRNTAASGTSFTIKVLGVSLNELLRLVGINRAAFQAHPKDDDAELCALAVRTCRDVLRDSQDAAARRDAFDLLVNMGAFAA